MRLRTEIPIKKSDFPIDHRHRIYLMGSCFSENVATKFSYFGFNVLSNSHGIIYNPHSIENAFTDLFGNRQMEEKDLDHYGGKYFSYGHHGMFDGATPKQVLANINQALDVHRSFISACDFVFITPATAWVYIENRKKTIVANCHKVPGDHFEKHRMRRKEIEYSLENLVHSIQLALPNAHVIFTLSPVKHLKDGFVENQLSKSLLHAAILELQQEKVHYFPAFEIMNDDLRDYRFWKADMMHPNELAIDYIWEKFAATYFSPETLQIMTEVKKLRQLQQHRPLHGDEIAMAKLSADKESKLTELVTQYPYLQI